MDLDLILVMEDFDQEAWFYDNFEVLIDSIPSPKINK